jgi:hypothetical protein
MSEKFLTPQSIQNIVTKAHENPNRYRAMTLFLDASARGAWGNSATMAALTGTTTYGTTIGSAANGVLTLSETGLYRVTASMSIDANDAASLSFGMMVVKNDATPDDAGFGTATPVHNWATGSITGNAGADTVTLNISYVDRFADGDTIRLKTLVGDGTAVAPDSTDTVAVSNADYYGTMHVELLV